MSGPLLGGPASFSGRSERGENTEAAARDIRVTHITPRRGPPVPVFNFEVDGQHVYSVGADGLLVHNDCHHIVSTFSNLSRGFNWTNKSQQILKRAGISLGNAINKVNLASHQGPHPELYHKRVFDLLSEAVKGKAPGSAAYRAAVENALNGIASKLKRFPVNGLNGNAL